MGSLIEELQRREAAARQEADELRGEGAGDLPGPAGQHRQRLDGHPVFCGRVIPGMEAPRRGPQVLQYVYEVDDEVDRRLPAVGLRFDQLDLVAVPVH